MKTNQTQPISNMDIQTLNDMLRAKACQYFKRPSIYILTLLADHLVWVSSQSDFVLQQKPFDALDH